MVDPNATNETLNGIAKFHGYDESFVGLHFYIDTYLDNFEGAAEDRYGFNTLSASFKALSENGTFTRGDEWRDAEEEFYAAMYVSLWLEQSGLGLENPAVWRSASHPPGIRADPPLYEHWSVDAETHNVLMQAAEMMNYWHFEVSDYGRRRFLRSEVPPQSTSTTTEPYMIPIEGAETVFNEAIVKVAESCPLWVPSVVIARGLTPEIAWDPKGETSQERLRSLLRCSTRLELEVLNTESGIYELEDFKLSEERKAGTTEALEEYIAWWNSKNLSNRVEGNRM